MRYTRKVLSAASPVTVTYSFFPPSFLNCTLHQVCFCHNTTKTLRHASCISLMFCRCQLQKYHQLSHPPQLGRWMVHGLPSEHQQTLLNVMENEETRWNIFQWIEQGWRRELNIEKLSCCRGFHGMQDGWGFALGTTSGPETSGVTLKWMPKGFFVISKKKEMFHPKLNTV